MENHQQKPIEIQIKGRKWNWIGHIMYRSRSNRENCIGLESLGILKRGKAEENVVKDNRGRNKKYRKIME
jgi:hypothetical protein